MTTADTAARLQEIRNGFAQVREAYARHKQEISRLIRVSVSVDKELVDLGEAVTVRFSAVCSHRPQPELLLTERIYDEKPVVTTHRLPWRRQGERFTAIWRWIPRRCGNHLISWTCDIGGDIDIFYRHITVIDNRSVVLLFNSTSHGVPRPEPDFHEVKIPFSAWLEPLLFGDRPHAEAFASVSRPTRQFGDDLNLFIYLSGSYVPSEYGKPWDVMRPLYDEPEFVQREVLDAYRQMWNMCGFPRPLDTLSSYGIGNAPVSIARSLGYTRIGALCADQNWQDGMHRINHWGMPARPFFISHEDFRKAGPGGRGAMVGFQQCQRQTCLTRDYNCVYSFEGGIGLALDVMGGVSRERKINEMSQSREKDFLECMIQSGGQSGHPLFLCAGVEFNGVWPFMAGCNRQLLEYCAHRTRDSHLAFTTPAALADYMRRRYRTTPESVLYLVDIFAGLTYNDKPVCYPDTLEIENGRFKSIFRKPDILPYVYYDYTTRWNYPDWGNETIPRRPNGYIVPDTPERFQITPRQLDTRGLEASVSTRRVADECIAEITVTSKHDHKQLALALWDLPCVSVTHESQYRLSGAQRFVPVQAPYTRNACGIVIADVRAGVQTITLRIRSPHRRPQTLEVQLNGSVSATVLPRDGNWTAYLYTTTNEPASVTITPPSGVDCRLYPWDSDDPVALSRSVTIQLSPGQPQRITGLSPEQLVTGCAT